MTELAPTSPTTGGGVAALAAAASATSTAATPPAQAASSASQSLTDTATSPPQAAPAAILDLSAEAQGTIDALAQESRDGQTAARRLMRGAAAARAEADTLKEQLDALAETYDRLFRQLGLTDEDSRTAAKAGRQAAASAAPVGEDQPLPGSVQVTTTQTLVVEVREATFTLTQSDDSGSTSITASVQSVSLSYRETTSLQVLQQEADPLVFDLDGNGIDAVGPEDSGQVFDLDGDGSAERVAWVSGNDALLAMDRDGDGKITSGRELFGDQNGAADGFAELGKLDSNQDGAIDAADEQWGALLLLKADGSTSSLDEAGVRRIQLDAIIPVNQSLGAAGRLAATSGFQRADGSTGTVGEAYFTMVA